MTGTSELTCSSSYGRNPSDAIRQSEEEPNIIEIRKDHGKAEFRYTSVLRRGDYPP
jgi:hypothetical protein